MDLMEQARVTGFVQPATSGRWRIEQFTVSEDKANVDRFIAYCTGRRRYVPAGTYTSLVAIDAGARGLRWMTDTPDEMRDHLGVLERGRGRVLIHGLGLGCVVKGLLSKSEVEHIDVVEFDEEVISLVGPYYAGERCTIHHGDAFTYRWPAGTRWDVVWHDIWPHLSEENLPEMARLHRRFVRRCAWQDSWGREVLLTRRRQARAAARRAQAAWPPGVVAA